MGCFSCLAVMLGALSSLIFFLSLLALLLGMLDPTLVIRWGEIRDKAQVGKIYGSAAVVSILLFFGIMRLIPGFNEEVRISVPPVAETEFVLPPEGPSTEKPAKRTSKPKPKPSKTVSLMGQFQANQKSKNKQANKIDNLIVPGERVGPYSIGVISETQIKQALGKPDSEFVNKDDASVALGFWKYGVTMGIDIESRLLKSVEIQNDHYVTDSGITVGSSYASVLTLYGQPVFQNKRKDKSEYIFYTQGIGFEISPDEYVSMILVKKY